MKAKNGEEKIETKSELNTEIDDLKKEFAETSPHVYEAGKIALEAIDFLSKDRTRYLDAKIEAFKALKIDPFCFDAYLLLIKILHYDVITDKENQTPLDLLRELICVYKLFIDERIPKLPKNFHDESLLRPYIRILEYMAEIAMDKLQLEVATYVCEEMLRVNMKQFARSTFYLLAQYIKIQARRKTNKICKVDRTLAQCYDLLGAKDVDGNNLFDVNNPEYGMFPTLAELYLDYLSGSKKWKYNLRRILRNLREKFNLIRELIYMVNSQDTSRLSTECHCNNCVSKFLAYYAFIDDPSFVIVLHNEFHSEHHPLFTAVAFNSAPNINSLFTQDCVKNTTENAFNLLENGRKTMMSSNYKDSILNFSNSFEGYTNAAYLWTSYLDMKTDALYPILTNRSTAAYKNDYLDLTRHDVRVGLTLKKDCRRLYEFPKNIFKQFNASSLLKEADDIWQSAQTENPDWDKLSRRIIALLSLRSIIEARLSRLNEEKIKELEEKGVEDMFAPISFPPNKVKMLPWLKDSDVEIPLYGFYKFEI